MVIFQILKITLCCWLLLLIVQSVSNDLSCLVLVSGVIITSMPFVLFLSWLVGSAIFRSTLLFTMFTLIVIALHTVQLAMW
jgi:hypothetical protein